METDYTSRQFASGPAFNANEQANILSGNEHLNRPENQVGFQDPTRAYGYVPPTGDYASRISTRPADAPQPVNEDEIRKRKTDEAQAIVNSINAQFAPLFSGQEEQNKREEARTRAINISSGLAGSDFASAAASETEGKGKKANEMIINERAARIAEVLSKVSSQTDDAIAAKRKAFNEDTTAYNTRRKEAVDEVKNNVTSLATSGVSIAKLKQSEPNVYKRLMEDGGFQSEIEFESFFNASKPKTDKVKYTYDTRRDGTIIRYGDNGEVKIFDDIKVPAEVDPQFIQADNGQILFVDKNKPTNADGTPRFQSLGNFSKPKESSLQPGENPQLYSGLSNPTATAVRAKVNQFKSEPLIQNFAVIQEGRNFANSIEDSTTNPADDQALIYALAKSLDPGSVVREGEYATAQKYAQSWIKAYGKGVEQALLGTGFLSREARSNIKKTIETKFSSSKRSYDNLSTQYKKNISTLTGRNDGEKFLSDYSIADQNSNIVTAPDGTEIEIVD